MCAAPVGVRCVSVGPLFSDAVGVDIDVCVPVSVCGGVFGVVEAASSPSSCLSFPPRRRVEDVENDARSVVVGGYADANVGGREKTDVGMDLQGVGVGVDWCCCCDCCRWGRGVEGGGCVVVG